MLTQLALPADPAVSLQLCKQHLRIDSNDENALIEVYRDSAIAYIEGYTTRALGATQYQQTFDAWPGACGLVLGVAPIREVSEVVYLDEAGAEQTISTGSWYLTKTPMGGTVRFDADYSQPVLYDRPGSLIVRFDAGYDSPDVTGSGDPELALPSQARSCALLLTAHAFENRAPVVVGAAANELPFTVQALLNQLRIYR
ncbi:MAG: head-tail connector protein [Alphaproteobacteria bacterium]|nr:head-tail connector protein [Alphaproteobacteria bacterium]